MITWQKKLCPQSLKFPGCGGKWSKKCPEVLFREETQMLETFKKIQNQRTLLSNFIYLGKEMWNLEGLHRHFLFIPLHPTHWEQQYLKPNQTWAVCVSAIHYSHCVVAHSILMQTQNEECGLSARNTAPETQSNSI